MHGLGRGRVADRIGLAIGEPRFDAAASHPHCERLGAVVAAVECHCCSTSVLSHRCASELAAPHDQRVFQHPTLFQISQQRRDGLVRLLALVRQSVLERFAAVGPVRVPAPIEQLHKADALFDQTPCEQAVVGKGFFARLGAVVLKRFGCFLRQIHRFGSSHLHSIGHLILSDPGDRFRIAVLLQRLLIECRQSIQHLTPFLSRNAFGVGDVQNRIAFGSALHSLVDRRQKA